MRKLVAYLLTSLDGVVESPDKWVFEEYYMDEGVIENLRAQIAEQDAVVLGRVSYEEWADYWPTAHDEPFASFINNTPKYVFSKTLDKVDWKNSTLVRGDLVAEINKLKQQPGKTIGTHASPELVHALLEHDLVDELQLVIYPVIAGSGKRFVRDGSDLMRLRLVNSHATDTGMVFLTYAPRNRA